MQANVYENRAYIKNVAKKTANKSLELKKKVPGIAELFATLQFPGSAKVLDTLFFFSSAQPLEKK